VLVAVDGVGGDDLGSLRSALAMLGYVRVWTDEILVPMGVAI